LKLLAETECETSFSFFPALSEEGWLIGPAKVVKRMNDATEEDVALQLTLRQADGVP
jgi:hypothetical protein